MRAFLLTSVFLSLSISAAAQNICAISASNKAALKSPAVIRPVIPYQNMPSQVFIAEKGEALSVSGSSNGQPLIDGSPAVQHVVESGASVKAIGSEHGLQTYVASSPGHFMVFDEAPDHQAIVAGTLLQIPLQTMLGLAKGRVQELPTAHSLRTFFLRTGEHFQVFYATPDEQRVIPGVMWDAKGNNLTRAQIASIPGTTPTVVIGPDVKQSRSAPAPSDTMLLQTISATASGSYGQVGAPHVWMFVDPQCSFSVRALQVLRTVVQAGKLRLSVIPVSLLDHEDQGLSTERALAMVDQPEGQMVQAWMSDDLNNPHSTAAVARLRINMAAASLISLKGTPTFLWRNKDGSLGRIDGVPQDIDAMLAAVGS